MALERHMLPLPPAHTLAQDYFLTQTKAETRGLTDARCPLFLTLLPSQRRKTARAQLMLTGIFSKQTSIFKIILTSVYMYT